MKPRPVVAIVDDDGATLDLLERALHDADYEAHRFERAEALLESLKEIQPDAIIMEAVLPGMNGLSALDLLRPKNIEAMIPVLILGKKEELRTKLLAFRKGAFDYVTKPFDAEEVAARIQVLVRNKLLQERLQEFSVSDPLTSVYNRRFILSWLEREIERVKRYGLDLSCLLIDLDSFGQVNRDQGEGFGDFLLQKVAELITDNTRSADIVGRLENDEFVVALPGTSKEQAMVVASRLRKVAGERAFQQRRKKIEPSFSIGIAGCESKRAPNAETFIAKAEEALQRARAVGKGETAVLGIG
jgi:diguanylate cyclase (GGDEF)-like protein